MNEYRQRLDLAFKRYPKLRKLRTVIDCCVQHDSTCLIFDGGECDCSPDMTMTTPAGKFSIDRNGRMSKLGPEAETIPTIADPRRTDTN